MKKLLYALVLLMVGTISKAQEPDLAKFKSMFVLNFIRYVDWSEEAKKGDFVIAIVNQREVAKHLKELSATKKFGFQDIVIKEFNSIEELTSCQVVFIGSSINLGKSKAVLEEKIKPLKTLVVTEREGSTNNGSMINFVVRDDKLKFEINQKNIEANNIIISSALTKMSNAILI
jgi:hypothetical protein